MLPSFSFMSDICCSNILIVILYSNIITNSDSGFCKYTAVSCKTKEQMITCGIFIKLKRTVCLGIEKKTGSVYQITFKISLFS
jgi:hypothetical protein